MALRGRRKEREMSDRLLTAIKTLNSLRTDPDMSPLHRVKIASVINMLLAEEQARAEYGTSKE